MANSRRAGQKGPSIGCFDRVRNGTSDFAKSLAPDLPEGRNPTDDRSLNSMIEPLLGQRISL
jgi:hypothetical protein